MAPKLILDKTTSTLSFTENFDFIQILGVDPPQGSVFEKQNRSSTTEPEVNEQESESQTGSISNKYRSLCSITLDDRIENSTNILD